MMKKEKDLHIIVDADDNTITLSEDLRKEMGINRVFAKRIFMFRMKDTRIYAFRCASKKFAATAECAPVSYNIELKTFGFVPLVPTVAFILNDMCIEHKGQHRFVIEKIKLSDKSTAYKIQQ